MTLNNLMVRFQWCSSFGECRVPSLPGPPWPRVVAPDSPIYGQIELNSVLMLNWTAWNRTVYMYKNRFDINNLQWPTSRMVPSILRGDSLGIHPFFWRFLLYSLLLSSFFVLLLFVIFSFISTCLNVSASNIPKYLYVSFSPSVLIFFLIW